MAPKKSKNQLKRERAKSKAKAAAVTSEYTTANATPGFSNGTSQFLSTSVDDENAPELLEMYSEVFSKFEEPLRDEQSTVTEQEDHIMESDDNIEHDFDDELQDDLEQLEGKRNLDGTMVISKKQRRKLNKLPISYLKSLVSKPELVEWYDADSAEAELLVKIKTSDNVVKVPDHWLNKRDYLSSQRTLRLKPLYELPDYIKATGIHEMRDVLNRDESSMKQQARERVLPKLGKLDLDYQKMHDAFFKYQSKPKLYRFGDLYYEGRDLEEIEIDYCRPGEVSTKLREALGMDPHNSRQAFPWIRPMQLYGPPPSYPELPVPGVNSNLPPGARYGAGGWGERPMLDARRPKYVVAAGRRVVDDKPPAIAWGNIGDDDGDVDADDDDDDDDGEDDEDDDEDDDVNDVNDDVVHIDGKDKREVGKSDEFPTESNHTREADTVGGDSDLTVKTDDDELEAAFQQMNPPVVTTKHSPKALYQVLDQKETSNGFMGGREYILPKKEE